MLTRNRRHGRLWQVDTLTLVQAACVAIAPHAPALLCVPHLQMLLAASPAPAAGCAAQPRYACLPQQHAQGSASGMCAERTHTSRGCIRDPTPPHAHHPPPNSHAAATLFFNPPALHVRQPWMSSRRTLRSFSTIGEFCEGSFPEQNSSALGSRVVSSSRALVRPDLVGACMTI